MKGLLFILVIFGSQFAWAETSEERMARLEERLDELELNQAFNKLNFSGSFLNQYENIVIARNRTDLTVPAAFEQSDQDSNLSVFFMRADLNFDVSISSNFSFYSTLGMSKFWNNTGRNTRSEGDNQNFQSFAGGYGFQDSKAQFDVAFLKYQKSGNPLSFAIGRMTTFDGPPQNQLDGLSRTGTYPFLSNNVIQDGFAAIYDFKNLLPPKNSLKLRLFYTPFTTVDNDDKSRNASSTDIFSNEHAVQSSSSNITILTEYTSKNLPGLNKFEFFHSYYTFDGIYFENGQDPTNEDVEYVGVGAHAYYVGFHGIAGTGLKISASITDYLVRSDLTEENRSNAYLYTINYTFSNSFNRGHILGLENIKTDEIKAPTDKTTMLVMPFYNITDGHGTHIYYTVPVGRNHVLRAGAIQYESRESRFYSKNLDEKGSSFYTRWKVFF